MPAQDYTMSDEEYEVYCDAYMRINSELQGIPVHLVVPVLIKLLVTTHLIMKDFTEETPGAKQLHDELMRNISNELFDRTNQHILERN